MQIRYQQRICTDKNKIEEFLVSSRVAVIGMRGTEYPYSVPVNYVWHDGKIYFHGMGSGKKNELLESDPMVCVTIFNEHATVADPVPCHADTAYISAMIFGEAERVTDFTEGAEALQAILDKFLPGHYRDKISAQLVEKYKSAHDGRGVAVYKIIPMEITVKENAAD